MSDCKHEHTGSCSPDGVYLYVTCMNCGTILAESDEGRRRWESCPGFEAKKYSPGSCKHCHRSAQQHYDALRQRVAGVEAQRNTVTRVLRETQARLAEAERDELRADARRYRWLRDRSTPPDAVYIATDRITQSMVGDSIDAAIDAAMSIDAAMAQEPPR